MSRLRIYASMVTWAMLGLLAMILTWQIVAQTYPQWHLVARLGLGILAFNMVYWVRAFARRRGWAIASYAPAGDLPAIKHHVG
jgi:hypothetical protein